MPQELRPFDISRLRKILSQCKFKLTHRPCSKTFSIKSITAKSADEITFTLSGRDGAPDEKTSLAAYYKKVYGKDLRYPRLPCVVYGQNNFVPMEFVALEPFNQLGPTKMSSDQVSDTLNHVDARSSTVHADCRHDQNCGPATSRSSYPK
jgi:eukaryotic translation initiation factor 2C